MKCTPRGKHGLFARLFGKEGTAGGDYTPPEIGDVDPVTYSKACFRPGDRGQILTYCSTMSSRLPVRDITGDHGKDSHWKEPEWERHPPSYMQECCCEVAVTGRMQKEKPRFAFWVTNFRPTKHILVGYYVVDGSSFRDVRDKFPQCGGRGKTCKDRRRCWSFAAATDATGRYMAHFVSADKAIAVNKNWLSEMLDRECTQVNNRWLKWLHVPARACEEIVAELNGSPNALSEYLAEEQRLIRLVTG